MNDNQNWYLRGELRDNSPWIIPITKRDFSIGRQESNDLILLSQGVSRQHARLRKDKDGLFLSDLGSKNGIYVNGAKITEETWLKEGDIIKIGSSEFNLSAMDYETGEERTLVKNSDMTQISFAEMYGLSEREYEVLFYLIRGQSVKQIGESLFISAGTAKNHVLKIYKKTGCHTRIELANLYTQFKGVK